MMMFDIFNSTIAIMELNLNSLRATYRYFNAIEIFPVNYFYL